MRPLPRSFPRKRESSETTKNWTPAFAGVSGICRGRASFFETRPSAAPQDEAGSGKRPYRSPACNALKYRRPCIRTAPAEEENLRRRNFGKTPMTRNFRKSSMTMWTMRTMRPLSLFRSRIVTGRSNCIAMPHSDSHVYTWVIALTL